MKKISGGLLVGLMLLLGACEKEQQENRSVFSFTLEQEGEKKEFSNTISYLTDENGTKDFLYENGKEAPVSITVDSAKTYTLKTNRPVRAIYIGYRLKWDSKRKELPEWDGSDTLSIKLRVMENEVEIYHYEEEYVVDKESTVFSWSKDLMLNASEK